MNKYQKSILLEFSVVALVTLVAVIGIIHAKDYINRTEALRAMKHLGQVTQKYKEQNGYIPPETYIENIKEKLQGVTRAGSLTYRGRWIGLDAADDEILAYAKNNTTSFFFKDGYVVLFLDGTVKFLPTQQFETLIDQQQSPEEKTYHEQS